MRAWAHRRRQNQRKKEIVDGRAILSHYICKSKNPEKILTPDDLKTLLQKDLPTPIQQAENFILYLGDNLNGMGDGMKIMWELRARIGCLNETGFVEIQEYLRSTGLLKGGIKSEGALGGGKVYGNIGNWSLTMEGWGRYEELSWRDGASTKGRNLVSSTTALWQKSNDPDFSRS